MWVSANHHTAFRVTNIERSARFYITALGGHWQTSPMIYEGPEADVIMGGLPGARFKVCHVGFDEGAIVLVEFLEPANPMVPAAPARDGIIHFAFQVDDVQAALERLERAGGKRYWPEVRVFDEYGFSVVCATDPDGHMLELVDVSMGDQVERLVAADPNNAPVKG
jgi:catechol 2,3-dioxygenase-like lactoylglutathione lyase family enzyme